MTATVVCLVITDLVALTESSPDEFSLLISKGAARFFWKLTYWCYSDIMSL
jgi:hypothetical protein